MSHKKTFLKVIITMLLSYVFAVGAIINFGRFFYAVFFTDMNDTTAAVTVLSGMVCTILFITLAKYSAKIERSYDREGYERLNNTRQSEYK
mgnify:CR=1 FL=1|tara:strand:- start:425 stop:697 length:273 start_codon:yes stop_codon:yes gene_type:complete